MPLPLAAIAAGGAIAKGLSSFFGGKKKAKAQDAYANKTGQADVDYSNAQTAYQTGVKNQQSAKDEKSRSARASLKSSLLKSLGPNIIGQDALPALDADAAYSPVDYSGAPSRTFTPGPSSSIGMGWDLLGGAAGAIGQGALGSLAAQDYTKALNEARFAYENPGVQMLPTSGKNYSKVFQSVFNRRG